MALPLSLLKKLEDAFGTTDKLLVQAERHRLTENYREENKSRHRRIENGFQRLSYLATRVPATYAVCEDVLGRLAEYDLEFSSLLDLGAGPGTAALCAHYIFPEIKQLTLIDQDHAFKEFAESFLENKDPSYHVGDITKLAEFPAHDLVTLSYAINELSDKAASQVVKKAWQATNSALVIMEPGTPKAFKRLKALREELIQQGASILAPCPHNNACPMAEDNWCHFSVRLERTPLHQYIKDVSLNYEDEKFSYLIAVKNTAPQQAKARILRKPLKRPGHIIFDLCTENGLQRETLSKKEKALYRRAQKLSWGDDLHDDLTRDD